MFMDSGRHSDCPSESAAASNSNRTPRFVFRRVSATWQRPTSNREADPEFKPGIVTQSTMFTRFGTTTILNPFGPLQDALRRRHFRSVDEVKESAYGWHSNQKSSGEEFVP